MSKTQSATRSDGYQSPQWLARYGRTLSHDEIRLVQGYRGLPRHLQEHLRKYASGLVIEHASEGRVLGAARELRNELDRRSAPSQAQLESARAVARRWARQMGRVALGGAR